MTKEKAFNILWVRYDYCLMGYTYEALLKSMSTKEVLKSLKIEKQLENEGGC